MSAFLCTLRDPHPFFSSPKRYFVNHHRGEMRGDGGIFFEDMSESVHTKQRLFDFCVDLGKLMVDYYSWVIQSNVDMPFSPDERDFQLVRRSRYVEFNLLHDRGTKFGLQAKVPSAGNLVFSAKTSLTPNSPP